MWILFACAPRPDAAYWPGRRWLAVLDAVAWLALALWTLTRIPGTLGILGPVCWAIALLVALARIDRAVWLNHRYRFTTWWLVRALSVLLMVGLALKAGLH
jgi:hypothetical protein